MDYTIFLDIIGTAAFSLSGYILAAKARYDILGIMVISFMSAFGGGVTAIKLRNKNLKNR